MTIDRPVLRRPNRTLYDYTCVRCAAPFRAPKADSRTPRRFCSKSCGALFQRHGAGEPTKRYPVTKLRLMACPECARDFLTKSNARRYCSDLCLRLSLAKRAAEGRWPPRDCKVCGVTFTLSFRPASKVCCSEVCAEAWRLTTKRAHKAIRRARKRGATAEVVIPSKVFERDAWRCQSCGVKTPPALRGRVHPRAPELDHIIPLADEGPHTYANTQCLCRACNIKKGAGPGGQHRLFG